MKALVLSAAFVLLSCEACDQEKQAWEGPCKNLSTIISTASGTPSGFTCPNKRHKMRVQLATSAAADASDTKETSALVVCECDPSVSNQ